MSRLLNFPGDLTTLIWIFGSKSVWEKQFIYLYKTGGIWMTPYLIVKNLCKFLTFISLSCSWIASFIHSLSVIIHSFVQPLHRSSDCLFANMKNFIAAMVASVLLLVALPASDAMKCFKQNSCESSNDEVFGKLFLKISVIFFPQKQALM